MVKIRGISSVLHFTTNSGTLGILASKALKSRARLNVDQQLKHIFQPNAKHRGKDVAWLDYVNLSVSRINSQFFETCASSWHKERDFWWCILDFSPEILTHGGVWFATTNNIYSGVRRQQGEDGLAALFADYVLRWSGVGVQRPAGLPQNFTTCAQAEVLYPGEVSTRFLKCMHVSRPEAADELAAQVAAVSHCPVPIEVSPELFEGVR